jgi:hypothetical protein
MQISTILKLPVVLEVVGSKDGLETGKVLLILKNMCRREKTQNKHEVDSLLFVDERLEEGCRGKFQPGQIPTLRMHDTRSSVRILFWTSSQTKLSGYKSQARGVGNWSLAFVPAK